MMPSDKEILVAAMESGFAISTAYGQGSNELMPISDRATLTALYRAAFTAGRLAGMEEAAGICESANNYDNPMTQNDVADAIRAAKDAT